MDGHIEVGRNTPRSGDLTVALASLRSGMSKLLGHRDAMAQMLDGDGSSANHFPLVVTLYSVDGPDQAAKNADAKALYDEINSTLGNSAALLQLLAKTGAIG